MVHGDPGSRGRCAPPQPRQGTILVRTNEPAVADDISRQDRCNFPGLADGAVLMPFTLAQAGSGRLTWSSKPDSGLFGRLVLQKPSQKRSQRKHRLSTSVKRYILTRAILAFSARNDTQHVIR